MTINTTAISAGGGGLKNPKQGGVKDNTANQTTITPTKKRGKAKK